MYPVQQNNPNPTVSAVQAQIINPTTVPISQAAQPQQAQAPYAPAYYPPANWVAPKSTQPQPSVGAVNIQIYNPTASPNGAAQGTCCPSPVPYYPPQYVPAQNNPINAATGLNGQNSINNTSVNNQTGQLQAQPLQLTQQPQQPQALAATNIAEDKRIDKQDNNVKSEEQTAEAKKADDKSKDKKKPIVVPLNDELIKSYENYLNNNNPQLRVDGIKQVLNRLKEDETRKDNPALINLVNKALQDPKQSVRLLALAALDGGYTYGNDFTVDILKKMQASNDAYNEDAVTASQVLLKMAQNDSIRNAQQSAEGTQK